LEDQREGDTERWSVADLIDFEFFVEEDARLARESASERKRLAERDRRLYLDRIAKATADSPQHSTRHRSRALRRWLTVRRRSEDPTMRLLLPGTIFARAQRLVSAGLGALGLLLGIGVASALLRYDGTHPVNVSWYVFVLVLVQILLVAATVGIWYARRTAAMQAAVQDISLIRHLIGPVFDRAARWIQGQRLAHIPPELRERARSRHGLLESHFALYGPAAYLPVLIPAQMFGIGFNVGAVVITVALEWFTDLAFGWGSALDVEPGTIHAIAHVIAWPWSWLFGEGVGVPTLEEVAGTRISLKDPLYLYDAAHLRSWRWFLVLAVITYGLIPRLALLALSIVKQRRTLAALPFTHQRTQALYARMITPSLEMDGASGAGLEMPIPAPLTPVTAPRAAPRSGRSPPERPKASAPKAKATEAPSGEPQSAADRSLAPPAEASFTDVEPAPEKLRQRPLHRAKPARKAELVPEVGPRPEVEPSAEAEAVPAQGSEPPHTRTAAVGQDPAIPADACMLLIHVDVADVLDEPDHVRLQRMLRRHTGWRVAASATFGGGSAMAARALGLIEKGLWRPPPARVALLQDGSQPPITENLRFLRDVRAAAGEQAQIVLTLVGDPDGEDPLPRLSDFDFADWQRKIEQMGDPYLRLEMLGERKEEAI
jgi:hypothetical protein